MLADPRQMQQLRSLLRGLSVSNPDIESSAVISTDGLIIATALDQGVDADRFGAMCASLLALAERAAQEVNRGRLRQTLVEGADGCVLLVQVGADAVLAISAKASINLGRVFLDARRAAAKAAELLVAS